jgi:glucose-1-phosphate cytidylyltransferase
MHPADIPVFILAGGLGTRLKEQTEFRPKPMIEIGDKPIIWHIMRWYGHFGFKKFVVCTGFRSEVIKEYFLLYDAMNSDFTVRLNTHDVRYHSAHHEEDWEVTIAYTGENTMTGARVARAGGKYLGNAEHFALTYGDGLCNADLGAELQAHIASGATGTVLAINPPSRFGELEINRQRVTGFAEKPELKSSRINGGYFFFHRKFLDYITSDESCVLEQGPLQRLTADGGLSAFCHDGFWACMDTQRDKEYLDDLLRSGRAPWSVDNV